MHLSDLNEFRHIGNICYVYFLNANVTKYIDTQMPLFCCFLHTCEKLERKFLLWFWHAR